MLVYDVLYSLHIRNQMLNHTTHETLTAHINSLPMYSLVFYYYIIRILLRSIAPSVAWCLQQHLTRPQLCSTLAA